MIRFLAIVIGTGLVGVFILVKLFGGNDGPAYVPAPINLAPRTVNTSFIDLQREKEQRIRAEVTRRFGDAPQHVIDLATDIANPESLLNDYSSDILSMTREEVNRGYGQPFPEAAPDYVHTLLREAVITGNTGAAALILDRGGDVSYNDDEMAFQAVNLEAERGKYDLWFPDYSSGSKFLRMWLDRRGNPDITHPLYGGGLGTLLNHTPKNNLEGTLSLLAFGADPWSPFLVTSQDGGFLYELPGYFASLSTGDRLHAEMSFRIAREGYYAGGPEAHVRSLRDTIERTSGRYVDASDTNGQNTLWALGKAYEEIFKSLDVSPGPDTRRIMSKGFSPEIGGFFLAPGEIRSPRTSDQEVYDRETQIGREKWR